MTAATAARGLFLRKEHAAFGSACGTCVESKGVSGTRAEVVMHLSREHCPRQQRRKNIRQEQVWCSFELITNGRMARDRHSVLAQRPDQPPYFRSTGAQLGCDLGAADHHRGV